MTRLKTLASFFGASLLFFTLTSLSGCGKPAGGLATDSGEMTLEEFQQLQEKEQAEISEAMQEDADKN